MARENKSRIIMWMAYWPWSLLWTTINDAVKRIYREIYQAIQRLLQGISDSVFKDVKWSTWKTQKRLFYSWRTTRESVSF